MEEEGLHEAIRVAADTDDFEPLFGYFADDIQLRISIALQSGASRIWRGRRAAIRQLRQHGGASPASEEPVELFSSDGRIVACRNVGVAMAGGLRVRDDCALVFDIRDGMIRHLSIHHEFSAPRESRRGDLDLAQPCGIADHAIEC